VVKQHYIGARGRCQRGQLADFACTDERSGFGPVARLEGTVYDNRARAFGQLAKLFERFFRFGLRIGRG
jgi:hypothetical protein